jgi:hypothetical protein
MQVPLPTLTSEPDRHVGHGYIELAQESGCRIIKLWDPAIPARGRWSVGVELKLEPQLTRC